MPQGRDGDDTLVGDAGNDTFVFKSGFGHDQIEDFVAGAEEGDVIQFDSSVFASFADIQANAVNDGADVLIDTGAGDTLRLIGVHVEQLSSSDFLIL